MAHLTIKKGLRASKNRVLSDGEVVENASFLAERDTHYLISVSKAKPVARPEIETATAPAYETRKKPSPCGCGEEEDSK